jgi:photosystem II stability/assembly factor-like uncharacterized protein
MKIKLNFILLILLFFSTQNSYSQWTHLMGLSQGEVTSVLSDAIGFNLYAATYQNGFYNSADNNRNYWLIYSFWPSYKFHTTSFSPQSSSVILAGTDYGILISYNAGHYTWDATSLSHDTVYCFKNVPDSYGILYRIFAGSSQRIYYSINGGGDWFATSLNKSVTGIEYIDSTIIAAANDNIYVSTNFGINWLPSDFNQKAFSLSVLNNKIFAGVPFGIYYSTNKGLNWIATSLNNINVYKWGIGTAGNNIIAYSSDGIYVSTNEGINWTKSSILSTGNSFSYVNGVAYIPSDKGRIFYSNDNGVTWNVYFLNNACVTRLNYKPGILLAGINAINGASQTDEIGLYHSSNMGSNWEQYPDYHNSDISAITSNNNSILVANNNILKKTTNNGLNWIQMNLFTQWGIKTLAYKGNSDTVFAGVHESRGVKKSIDGGNNWDTMDLKAYNINDFAFLKDKIFVATFEDGPSPNFGVFISSDQGYTWNRTGLDSVNVSKLATAGSRIFAITYNRNLYYSDNFGTNWSQISYNFISTNCMYAIDSLNIIVGTYGNGIFSSSNSGATWHRINENVYDMEDYISTITRVDNYIICGTYFGGIKKRPVSDFVDVTVESVLVPDNYSLLQNYPNPFNPSTIIKYNVSKAADITIKVYDISGKEIATLVQEYKTPGTYQVTFSGDNLTSGVYFYRLETKTYSETKKMILIK